jgi:hypothetical protein
VGYVLDRSELLFLALKAGQKDAFAALLNERPALWAATDSFGSSLGHLACQRMLLILSFHLILIARRPTSEYTALDSAEGPARPQQKGPPGPYSDALGCAGTRPHHPGHAARPGRCHPFAELVQASHPAAGIEAVILSRRTRSVICSLWTRKATHRCTSWCETSTLPTQTTSATSSC